MADTDLAITGKDAKLVLLVAGAPVLIADAVVNSSAEEVLTTVEQKHIGTSDVDLDVEHEGWKGEVEASVKNSAIDEMIDEIALAGRNRTPIVINVVETERYRDGTSSTYTYPDVKITAASGSRRRGEVTTRRISWRTGKARIRS